MSEIESRLYNKFNITITDVKALLADSGIVFLLSYCFVLLCSIYVHPPSNLVGGSSTWNTLGIMVLATPSRTPPWIMHPTFLVIYSCYNTDCPTCSSTGWILLSNSLIPICE